MQIRPVQNAGELQSSPSGKHNYKCHYRSGGPPLLSLTGMSDRSSSAETVSRRSGFHSEEATPPRAENKAECCERQRHKSNPFPPESGGVQQTLISHGTISQVCRYQTAQEKSKRGVCQRRTMRHDGTAAA
ncbi:hypothetical protein SRHO_G00276480 [Serrasalmus rhombeus]